MLPPLPKFLRFSPGYKELIDISTSLKSKETTKKSSDQHFPSLMHMAFVRPKFLQEDVMKRNCEQIPYALAKYLGHLPGYKEPNNLSTAIKSKEIIEKSSDQLSAVQIASNKSIAEKRLNASVPSTPQVFKVSPRL